MMSQLILIADTCHRILSFHSTVCGTKMAASTMKIATSLLSLWYCFMTTTAFTAVTTVPSSSKFGVVGHSTHNRT